MNPLQGLALIIVTNILLSNSKAVAQNNSAASNSTTTIANETTEQINKKAQQAFKEKNYQVALTYYLRAAKINPSFTTKYNLAVCYYKLNQWHDALNFFDQLYTVEPHNDLVHLNLILTLIKLNEDSAALNHLQLLSKIAQSDAIAALAYQKHIELSKKIRQKEQPPHNNQWLLAASLSKGSDDNINTIIDETQTQTSDTYTEATASIGWYNSANIDNSWLVDFTTYASVYDESETYNVNVYDAGLKKNIKLSSAIQLHGGVRIGSASIAKEGYLQSFSMYAGGHYNASKNDTITVDVLAQKSDALSDIYEGLAGDSVKVTGQYIKKIGPHRFRLKYRLDDEDRNDDGGLETVNGNLTFTSYSATRHSISGEWRYSLDAFDFLLGGSYRASTYHDEHLFLNDDGGLRKDKKYALFTEVRYAINPNWTIHLNGTTTTNSSSLTRYDYTQNLASIGISWQN